MVHEEETYIEREEGKEGKSKEWEVKCEVRGKEGCKSEGKEWCRSGEGK